jgi:hypothetical protein
MTFWEALSNEGLYSYHIQQIHCLDLGMWVGGWNSAIGLMHIPAMFTKVQFTHDGISTKNSHLWAYDKLHGTVESNFQHCFSVSVWCSIIGDQLIGPYIFPHHLTSDIYTGFFQHEVLALVENIPLQTQLQMYYQHDGAPHHFTWNITQYLNEQFPDQQMDGSQNWPPYSLYLSLLDFQVWVACEAWCMNTSWTQEMN